MKDRFGEFGLFIIPGSKFDFILSFLYSFGTFAVIMQPLYIRYGFFPSTMFITLVD